MTKDQKVLLLGAAGVGVAIYLISKSQKEQRQREMIRQQQLMNQANQRPRGQGLANVLGLVGNLFDGKGRKGRKRDKAAGNGLTIPDLNIDSATIGNIGGNTIDPNDPFGVGDLNIPPLDLDFGN